MITVRDKEAKGVVEKLEFLIGYAKEHDWKPTWKEEPSVESDEGPKAEEPQTDCPHTTFKVKQVKKEGANKGKWFKTCDSCGEFLGWVKV